MEFRVRSDALPGHCTVAANGIAALPPPPLPPPPESVSRCSISAAAQPTAAGTASWRGRPQHRYVPEGRLARPQSRLTHSRSRSTRCRHTSLPGRTPGPAARPVGRPAAGRARRVLPSVIANPPSIDPCLLLPMIAAALQSAEAENGGKREQGASYLGHLREGCLAVLARCCPLPRPPGTT